MLIQTAQDKVIQSGKSESFSVKINAKAFQVIISNQYSDLPRALVMELVQNAYDSHIKAGRGELPIEIQCPNDIDNKFIVTDYGTGMSHDFMMNRYTQVFDSTKDDSNQENGGYGWGRLVGLAFDGGFFVKTVHDKVYSVYYIGYNSGGVPCISHIGSSASEKPNGTSVEVRVPKAQHDAIKEWVSKICLWINPKPSVVGQDVNFPNHIQYENEDIILSRLDNCGIISGIYHYQFHAECNRYLTSIGGEYGIFVKVPVGVLTPNSSRTEIQWKPQDYNAVLEILKRGVEKYKADLYSSLSQNINSLYEFIEKNRSAIGVSNHFVSQFLSDGKACFRRGGFFYAIDYTTNYKFKIEKSRRNRKSVRFCGEALRGPIRGGEVLSYNSESINNFLLKETDGTKLFEKTDYFIFTSEGEADMQAAIDFCRQRIKENKKEQTKPSCVILSFKKDILESEITKAFIKKYNVIVIEKSDVTISEDKKSNKKSYDPYLPFEGRWEMHRRPGKGDTKLKKSLVKAGFTFFYQDVVCSPTYLNSRANSENLILRVLRTRFDVNKVKFTNTPPKEGLPILSLKDTVIDILKDRNSDVYISFYESLLSGDQDSFLFDYDAFLTILSCMGEKKLREKKVFRKFDQLLPFIKLETQSFSFSSVSMKDFKDEFIAALPIDDLKRSLKNIVDKYPELGINFDKTKSLLHKLSK